MSGKAAHIVRERCGANSQTRRGLWLCAAAICALWSGMAHAQTAPAIDAAQRQRVERQLTEIKAYRQDMARQMGDMDARIRALEVELHGAAAPPPPPSVAPSDPVSSAAATAGDVQPGATQRADVGATWGSYEPGKGFVVVRSDVGEASLALVSYARYLNQTNLEDTYTDHFGRTIPIQTRQDLQLSKVQITLKGWLFDPKFNYNAYFWTSNSNQGQSAQVVGAGNLSYHFNSALQVFAGVQSVPSTRSTNRTFPYWLRNDNRPIADEFFRGSYTQGIWAQGKIARGLEYRVMIANNLSALGVNAGQLDDKLNTISGALAWMPTTGEFGPLAGFGDFEEHQEVATLFGVHYTSSTETPQSQPGTESIENTQLRLSDGTLLFRNDAFNTPGRITEARYQMLDLNAGVKYRGYSLEFEYYARWLNDFTVEGVVPVGSLFDSGFQLQASAMLIPKELQLYVSGSKIFGEYGDPYDIAVGLNWFPFSRKEFRVNAMGLYVDRSPVGYSAYPLPVGGEGFTFITDFSLVF